MSQPEKARFSPIQPNRPGEPVFKEPWEAEAFALAVHLHDRGLFTWTEWADTLSSVLSKNEASETDQDYYVSWLEALECILATRSVTTMVEINDLTAAWQRAALATPHGNPVLLDNDPQKSGRRAA